jgi:tetratricopeptide (TPR) repeat protein
VQDDLDAARRYYIETLEHEQALHHVHGAATVLCNLGEVADAKGEHERACRLFAAAEQLFDAVKSVHAAYAADLLAGAAAKSENGAALASYAAPKRPEPVAGGTDRAGDEGRTAFGQRAPESGGHVLKARRFAFAGPEGENTVSALLQLRTWLALLSLLILTLLPLPGAAAADPPKPAPEVQALLDKGNQAGAASRLEEALRLFNEALEKSRALGDKSGEGKALRSIGNVYFNTGKPQKALEFYQQALPLYRQADDKAGEGNTLGNIGNVYSTIGQPQKRWSSWNNHWRCTGK